MITLPFFTLINGTIFYLEHWPYLNLQCEQKTISHLLEIPPYKLILQDYGIVIPEMPLVHERKKSILFIEPHPDDLAFSCGGFIMNARKNFQINVLTVFSKSSLASFPWNSLIKLSEDDYSDLRKNESIFAFKTYLQDNVHVLEWKLPTRRGHTSPFEKMNAEDCELSKMLHYEILEEISNIKPDIIVGPLGIGGHIDHLICFQSIIALSNHVKNVPIFFYEDMPYSRNKKKYAIRMQEVKESYSLLETPENIIESFNFKAALSCIYKSQIDDFTFSNLLGCILADGRSRAEELSEHHELQSDMAECLWQLQK